MERCHTSNTLPLCDRIHPEYLRINLVARCCLSIHRFQMLTYKDEIEKDVLLIRFKFCPLRERNVGKMGELGGILIQHTLSCDPTLPT